MACCGSECTIAGDYSSAEAFNYVVSYESSETDVRSFDSTGDMGDWLACGKSGSITVDTYVDAGLSVGDTSSFSATVCGDTITTETVVTGYTITVDAKGLATWSYTLRMTD